MTAPANQQRPNAAQIAATIAAYQAASGTLRLNLAAYITALWQSLGEYRNAQMAQFIAQVTPVVAGAQQQMASLTAAYLAAHQSAVLGTPLQPVYVNPAAVSGAAVRNGVSPDEVYGRPFHTVWRQLGAAKEAGTLDQGSVDTAIKAGLDNAVSSAVTDVQLAKTHTSQQVMKADHRVVGYRRVLEGAHSCGLCIVASTQRYHKADLLPIHPACDCSEDPIYGTEDPGRIIDLQTLSDVHQAIADRFGRDSSAAKNIPGQYMDGKPVQYRDVLITHQHGELGPVLAVKGQTFTAVSV